MRSKQTIKSTRGSKVSQRRGVIVVFAALLIVPLFGMVAFSVDYGYLHKSRASLQRAADVTALAAVRDLVPADDGSQDLNTVRATVRQYAAANVTEVANFSVLDSDIEIGRYDPATAYSNFTILNSGVFDTVRVTLRRDAQANGRVSLFFARVMGINNSDIVVTATAVLQKASILEPGADVLPFSVPQDVWDARPDGDVWSVYGDGRIRDDHGSTIPGNWGTVDIGPNSNSTTELSNQILNGLLQSDLDALHSDGRIPTNEHIDGTQPLLTQAETGLSSGLKHAVQAVHGQTKLIPIYNSVRGGGNNAEFNVIKWGVVEVVNSGWKGNNKTHVTLKRKYTFNGKWLKPQIDLSKTDNVIDGGYTSPALVE